MAEVELRTHDWKENEKRRMTNLAAVQSVRSVSRSSSVGEVQHARRANDSHDYAALRWTGLDCIVLDARPERLP